MPILCDAHKPTSHKSLSTSMICQDLRHLRCKPIADPEHHIPISTIMQRGFLLSPQHRQKSSKARRSTSATPQCQSRKNTEAPKQRRRVVTTSSDLLDLENNRDDIMSPFQLDNGHDNECNDSLKGRRAVQAELDDVIISDASITQPLIVPSANLSPGRRDDKQHHTERPLIVEVGDSNISSNVKNTSLNTKPLLVEVSTSTPSNQQRSTNPTCSLDRVRTADRHLRDDVTTQNMPMEKDVQHFVNELSLLLSSLRRIAKHNDQSCGPKLDDRSFFNDMYMNITTEMEVKSFIIKHFHIEQEPGCKTDIEPGCKTDMEAKVGELLIHILESIVQDYSAKSTSICKKVASRSTALSWNSPHLAVGLCLLAYSDQHAFVYGSLNNILLDSITTSNKVQPNNAECNSQKKVLALGVIYLLRCWIRCMSVKLTSLELQLESNSEENVSIDPGAGLLDMKSASESLLMIILPMLEKIVSSDVKRTVFALAAIDACFEMIEFLARITVLLQATEKPLSTSTTNCNFEAWMLIWRSNLAIIDRLLVVKQNWVSRGTKSNNDDKQDNKDSSIAKSKSSSVVVDDWREMLMLSKRSFFDYLLENKCMHDEIQVQLHDGADFVSFLSLLWNLAGIQIKNTPRKKDKSLSIESISRVGGFAQSLCHDQECTVGHVGAGPLSDYGGALGAEDLVWSLQEAVRLRCNLEAHNKSWSVKARERSTIRSFISWVSKRKKNIISLSRLDINEEVFGALISYLRLDSKACVKMSLAAISLLWEQSPILKPDEMSDTDCTRQFSSLLEALRQHAAEGDDDNIDPTTEALCALVCKAASQRPSLLLPLVQNLDSSKSVVVVTVMKMLEQLPDCKLVQEAVVQIIMEHIDTLAIARARIQVHQAELCRLSCTTIVPPCLEYLTKKYAEKKQSPGVASVSMLLRNVMLAKANGGSSNEFVKCVLMHFQVNGGTFNTFLDKNISLWRSRLLEDSSSPTAFNNMVLAAAIEVIASPSSSMHLSLLSGMVRIDGNIVTDKEDKKEKILIATSSILDFATAKLSEQNKSSADTNVFTSIAPLLVLRCFPQSCYQLVHQALPSSASLNKVMVDLERFLSESMRAQAITNAKTVVGKQERMLVAEITGHCLSLSRLYDICSEAFSAVLSLMRNETQLKYQGVTRCVVQSKSALYALCHRIPLAPDEDDGIFLCDVTSFVMEVLSYNLASSNLPESLEEEILMLQSGCINYFAVVMDSLFRRNSNDAFTSQMVQEVDSESYISSSESNHTISILEALSKISDDLISVISTGQRGQKIFGSAFSSSTGSHDFSPQSRTAVLNSLVVLSQMNQGDDSKLKRIARNYLPLITRWTQQGPIDDSVHHPLCIAAGFQVIYTLLASLGSFDFGPERSTVETQKRLQSDFVCLALRCALNSFGSDTTSRPITVVRTLRVAALKLMLSLLAIYRATSDDLIADFLKPVEIQKAIKAVEFAAVSDENPDVRRLASEIVPQLQSIASS